MLIPANKPIGVLPCTSWQLRVLLVAAFGMACWSCASETIGPKATQEEITYKAIEDGEIWFRHSQIQLRFDSEMYCRVFLVKEGNLLSINDIPPDTVKARPPHYLSVEEREIRDFRVDFRNIGVSEIKTQLGIGKSLHLTGYAATPSGSRIEKDLTVELFHKYPDMALLTVTYRNLEKVQSIRVTRVVNNFFRLDSARTRPGRPSYDFQAVQGRPDSDGANVLPISDRFKRTYEFPSNESTGIGSVPLVDLWNVEMGLAIGEISRRSQVSIAPLAVTPDQKLEISMQTLGACNLGPNEVLTTPKSFWMVHGGGPSAAFERYSVLAQPEK
jgi:hypothetical protein